MNFQQNNLDKVTSPYLQQHKDNPIYWQEWSTEIIEYAKQHNKLILLSSGYATCHWCHVMAHDTFENQAIADFLNEHFVSIKIDREQRPDIDQYMISYSIQFHGISGWPLNVIFTPDFKPFAAVTYLAAEEKYGQPAFITFLQKAKEYYDAHKDKVQPFHLPSISAVDIHVDDLIDLIEKQSDELEGGFGHSPKFPPHATLLFLLHYFERTKKQSIYTTLKKTLDIMALRGLHDHLQGGFFRYCVDRAWTIPHFEKMLYDQALLLWVYSAAYKVLKHATYKTIAEKIITCLEETFEHDGLFWTGHDADIEGKEGSTYLWTKQELETILTPQEFSTFNTVYIISEKGNFEGKNHLIKTRSIMIPEVENKLLAIRKGRSQPFIDKKHITSWNALTGIALLMAYRYIGSKSALDKAHTVFNTLLHRHIIDNRVYHSSIEGNVQKQEFLEDYASMLLFATYIHEETGEHQDLLQSLNASLQTFYKDGTWYETQDNDFMAIPAQLLDHPIPSSISLAEYAMLRTQILLGKSFEPIEYKEPLRYDFFNLNAFVKNGHFHIIDTPHSINWDQLPINAIQRKGTIIQNCFNQACSSFDTIESLINSLK